MKQCKAKMRESFPDPTANKVIRLIHSGVDLRDNRTVRDERIGSESTVHVVFKVKQPGEVQPPPIPPRPRFTSDMPNWPVDTSRRGKLFVYCGNPGHGEGLREGGAPARVHQAVARPTCSHRDRHEAVMVTSGEPTNVMQLMNSLDFDQSEVRGECFICNIGEMKLLYELKCKGDVTKTEEDGSTNTHKCNGLSKDMICHYLPQMLSTDSLPDGNQTECGVVAMPLEYCECTEMVLKFDPCGCVVSLEGFKGHMESIFAAGAGRLVARSPLLNNFVYKCPVVGCPTPDSFVHDLHHYKILELAHYERIKTWALEEGGTVNEEQQTFTDPTQISAENITAREHRQKLEKALSIGSMGVCPHPDCGQGGVKDGQCTHVQCNSSNNGNRHPDLHYCYWCGGMYRNNNDSPMDDAMRALNRDNPCLHECPYPYLPNKIMPNNVKFSSNKWVACTEFHHWKMKRVLWELHEEIGHAAFEVLYNANAGMFADLCGSDGINTDGRRENPPIAGVSFSIQDILDYGATCAQFPSRSPQGSSRGNTRLPSMP